MKADNYIGYQAYKSNQEIIKKTLKDASCFYCIKLCI